MATCPVCGKTFASKKDLRSHVFSKHSDKAKHYYQEGGRKSSPKASGGSLKTTGSGVGGWIAMEEYLGKCSSGVTLLQIAPGKTGMPRLDAYALLYDQYCIEKWNIRITPRVGTTVSGMYIAGVVYSHSDKPAQLADVAALQPKIHHAIWQGGSLNVAPSRLMKQKWMYVYQALGAKEDMIAGYVAVAVDGTSAEVDVWVDYAVKFNGPTATQSDKEFKLVTDGGSWKLNDKPLQSIPDTLNEGYTVDIESDKDVSAFFKEFFNSFKTLDTIVSKGVYYYHVIADSFIANAALVTVGAPVIMHVARRPFPALLRTGRSSLSGEIENRQSEDQKAEAAGDRTRHKDSCSDCSEPASSGSSLGGFERV